MPPGTTASTAGWIVGKASKPTAVAGPYEKAVATAVTDKGTPVIVAAQYGKGIEIRTGLLDFATRLKNEPNAGELVLRAWTLLSS